MEDRRALRYQAMYGVHPTRSRPRIEPIPSIVFLVGQQRHDRALFDPIVVRTLGFDSCTPDFLPRAPRPLGIVRTTEPGIQSSQSRDCLRKNDTPDTDH